MSTSIRSATGIWFYLDTEPPLESKRPRGPFQTITSEQEADLLLFVPRNEISRAINELTGRYGYSHLAIDCGEIDVSTGRPVMIEVTVGHGVHYAFQDEYGKRPFVRIPLRKVGMDVDAFCRCVHSKVGEKFDELEAITLGIMDDPVRQICSDLATVCLPEDMRDKIARFHKKAVLHPLSVARDNVSGNKPRLFMSPNGFAEFFGAPRGRELTGGDQLAVPHIRESNEADVVSKLWKRTDAVVTSLWKIVKKPHLQNS